MAHQDYVSRKKSPPKGKKSAKSRASAEQSGISFKTKSIALITIVALSVFSYFLWSIKDKAAEVENTSPEQHSISPIKDEVALPVYDQDADFDFMKDLKVQNVEPGKYEVNNKGPYLMQCGSFKRQSQAEELKAKIAFSGISSKVRQTKGSNGTWYKVVLGPYERKRLAENDKHKLSRNKINHCQIWLWR